MKKKTALRALVCLLFCLLLAAPAVPGPVAAEGNVLVYLPVNFEQTGARAMLTDINAFRTDGSAWYWNETDTQKVTVGKLSSLAYSYELEKMAMQRAAEIALTFEHTRPDGTRCFTAAEDIGLRLTAAGENIAAGYPTAHDVFIGWREDDKTYAGQGHRRNMLGDFTHVGVGHAVVDGVHYWVQEFGKGAPVGSPIPDGNVQVPITVAPGRVTDSKLSTEDGVPAISLAGGEQRSLPTVTGVLRFAESWRYEHAVSILPAWTAAGGGNRVLLKDGTLTGHASGSVTLTASLFGKTLTLPVTVTSGAHSFSEWTVTKQPSCTESGASERTCSVCGERETQTLPAPGHDYKEALRPDGSTHYACARCGTARDYLPGDVNGDGRVTAQDRLVLSRYLASWADYGEDSLQKSAADLDGNGRVTSADRNALARHLAQWDGYLF